MAILSHIMTLKGASILALILTFIIALTLIFGGTVGAFVTIIFLLLLERWRAVTQANQAVKEAFSKFLSKTERLI